MVNARENLGPAERIINTLVTYSDHIYHGRPGVVMPVRATLGGTAPIGVEWKPCAWKDEDGKKVVYELRKVGKKQTRVKIGELASYMGRILQNDRLIATPPDLKGPMVVVNGTQHIGEYRKPGLFPEAAAWFYRQVADVYKLDNEFAAKWASYAWAQEHRDLKTILAAFMLVQTRKGDPVIDGGKVAFHDEDYRDVGEAMMLINAKDDKGLAHSPKHLLRIHELLTLPAIAEINRELGFGNSARKPFLGRWPKAVEKWLAYREENPKLLTGLVKAGYSQTIRELARRIGYKPASPKFFETLRWKQAQADDGRRTMLDVNVATAESWVGKTEREICEAIVASKPSWKRIVGLLPAETGVTRAIMGAAIEAGGLSNKDLVIATPTLEELGLTTIEPFKSKWEAALKAADDTRSANVAKNVRNKETADKLVEAAEQATQKAVEEVTRGLRLRFFIDSSGSMQQSIEMAKQHIARFLPAFPLDRVRVVTFNTAAREIALKHASAAGVEVALRGLTAGGGTDYGAGVRSLSKYAIPADEDVIDVFIGDEEANDFDTAYGGTRKPIAFLLLKVPGGVGNAVTNTARKLGIPCLPVDERIFADAYAVPRTLRNLIAATPVGVVAAAPKRKTLVDQILDTKLLTKPAWA